MLKIAIIFVNRGKYQDVIVKQFDYLYEALSPLKHQTSLIEVGCGEEASIEASAKTVISQDFSLIISIGVRCSLALAKMKNKTKNHTPVICVNIDKPIELGLIDSIEFPGGDFTGVGVKVPSPILPAQIVLHLNYKVRNIAILYRPYAEHSRIVHEVKKLKRFISASGHNPVDIPVHDGRSISECLSEAISNNDCIIIVPISGLAASDMAPLDRFCSKRKIKFFASAEGIMPPNAIWGYKADIEHVGFAAVQIASKILKDKKHASEIPYTLLEDCVRPILNPNSAKIGGVTTSPEILCSFDDSLDYQFYARHSLAFFAPWASTFDSNLYSGIGKYVMPQRTGIELCTMYLDGWPENDEFTQRQMAELITNDDEPLILTTGGYGTRLLQEKMLELNTFKPIISVRPADDTADAEPALNDSRWPVDNPKAQVSRIILPAYKPLRAARAVKFTYPSARRVGIIHTADPQNIPPLLASRIKETTNYFAEHKTTVVQTGSWDRDTLKRRTRTMAAEVDIIIWYPDFMHPCLNKFFEELTEQHPHLFICGGEPQDITAAHITCGYDTHPIADRVYEMVVDSLHYKKQLPHTVDLSSQRSLFVLHINTDRTQNNDNIWHDGLAELINDTINKNKSVSEKIKTLLDDDVELYTAE